MKAILRIISATLAVVLLLGTLVGCASVYKPLTYLKKTLEKSFEESTGGKLFSFLLSALDGGSVALDFGGTDLVDTALDEGEVKVWFDAEDHNIVAEGDIVLAGEHYTGAVFVNDERMVLKSPTFFGSTTLGVDFVTLEQDLKNSIFSNNSGTAYAKSEVSESTAKSVEEVKSGLFSLLASTDDWLDLSDEVLETFLAALAEQAYNNRYREGGRTYVSLSVDNDALSRAVRETRNELVGDRSFCREMRKLAATKDALESARTGVVTSEHSTELEYFLTSSSDIDALCLKIDNADPFVFELDVKIKSAGDVLEWARATYTENGEERLNAELLLAPQGEESSLAICWDGVARTFTYCVTKDSYRAFAADFSYEKCEGDERVFSAEGTLSADRREDCFLLSYTADGVAREFEGTYHLSAAEFSFSVDEAELDGEERTLELSLIAKRSDKAPKAPEYTNVITINTTRYAPIHERASAAAESFLDAWEEIDLTPHAVLSEVLSVLGIEEEIPPMREDGADTWWSWFFD